MKEDYYFEIINDRAFAITAADNETRIGKVMRLDNQQNLIDLSFKEDGRVKEIETTFIFRNINTDDISINRDSLIMRESLSDYQLPYCLDHLLNYSNDRLKILLEAADKELRSYCEDGSMTYCFNGNNELVMLEKELGEEEKGYFEYILAPLPVRNPEKVLEEIASGEGINILYASFLGDESWEEKMVNSYYHLRFIYDDHDGISEKTYPYEMCADIKGVGVRELFKRLEEDDLESYEMLHSGFKLKENDYISQIRVFTRKNTPYNNILRKYLAIQKNILKNVEEGDVVLTNFLLAFIRRTQLMREIEFYESYPLMTYEFAFESDYLPYIGALTSLKDKLLEYRKDNPLTEINQDMIRLMEHLTNYTVPDEDDFHYDIQARDELLAKADELTPQDTLK